MLKSKAKNRKRAAAVAGAAPCSATTTGLEITYIPSYRYTLQWNFGKSQCSFDTAKDVAAFIRNELPNIEKHGSPNDQAQRPGLTAGVERERKYGTT